MSDKIGRFTELRFTGLRSAATDAIISEFISA
jgi:hypothetical protein